MRRIGWSMLFVFTFAVLGAAGCENAGTKSQTSSGAGPGTSDREQGKTKAPSGPGKSGQAAPP